MILVAPGIVVPIHADSLAVDVQCRWSYEDWEPCHFVADPVGQSWKLAFPKVYDQNKVTKLENWKVQSLTSK